MARKLKWVPTLDGAKTVSATKTPDQTKERRAKRLRLREPKSLTVSDLLGMADALHWYALQVPPQKEFVAQVILERYGLATYIPTRHEWRRRNKFSKEKDLRKFTAAPRYVFAGFHPGRPLWFDLFALPVISAAVGINGEPIRIPGIAMRELVKATGGGVNAPDAHRFMQTHQEFGEGDVVQILGTPFDGMKVPVKSIAGNRARLVFELFGGLVDEIDLPLEQLVAA